MDPIDPCDSVVFVVKGISDFADEERDDIIEQSRGPACLAAARFVLRALTSER